MSRQQRLQHLLNQFNPIVLKIEDESFMHQVPIGAETHFKLTIVSDSFISYSRLQRQRLINHLVKDEFKQGLHALSMYLYTVSEWEKLKSAIPNSPPCLDGYTPSS